MDQSIKSTLADCYSEVSEIWLSTAKIARGHIDHVGPHNVSEVEFWEAFERRCCIRAGYYARLAEQHRPPLMEPGHIDILGQIKETEEWQKKPKGRAGGVARAKKLSPKRRSEIALKAAIARWKEPPNVS